MIQLGSEILLLVLSSGEQIPCSQQTIGAELRRQYSWNTEPEVMEAVAMAVWHYFRRDLKRDSVPASEFLKALRRVFLELDLSNEANAPVIPVHSVCECNLADCISANDSPLELEFYPKIRMVLRACLAKTPRLLRIRGLRTLSQWFAGSRRWDARCRQTRNQILNFLRDCVKTEGGSQTCPVVIE